MMTEELVTAAKQAGLEIIDMSDMLDDKMETWADVLARNPESVTATSSAGFVNKPAASQFELVVDVQTAPDQEAVLRTWVIETKVGYDQKEYFNNVQLTFQVDGQQARAAIAKGGAISRDDIRLLLQTETSRLANITISNESGVDSTKKTRGERYDFTIAELNQSPSDTAKAVQALQVVLRTLKRSLASSL